MRTPVKRRWTGLVLALAVISTGSLVATADPEQDVMLFSEQEAEEFRIQGDSWDPVPRARSAPLGPVIMIHAPDLNRTDGEATIETSSPTSMRVEFQKNLAPVDMSSLRVSAKKGIFSKSLTDKLAPFVEGTTIAVNSMEVPSGKFQIEILIKDLEGQETRRMYRLVVLDQ